MLMGSESTGGWLRACGESELAMKAWETSNVYAATFT